MKHTHSNWARAGRLVLAATALACAANASAQLDGKRAKDEPALNMVATSELKSLLVVDGRKQAVSGRLSVHLSATHQQLEEGVVSVGGFNVVYMDADQQLIAGRKVDGKERGLLAFAARNDQGVQELDYDARSGRISGELFGTVDADFMGSMVRSRPDFRPGLLGDQKGDDDLFETVSQRASLYVEMALNDALPRRDNASPEQERRRADARLELRVEADAGNKLYVGYRLDTIDLTIDWHISWFLETARSLCVQPVRIGRITFTGWGGWPFSRPQFSVDYTGAGLDFGLPGARTQWNKADIVFNVRNWKTVFKGGYFEMDTNGSQTSAEEAALHAEVTDADCIEVFFVENNDPVDAHGGGATWGSGTSTARIITSDGNAVGGIDLTHLAHELGHVLNLFHPTASSTNESTGTLMCPSGWMNDNPAVNSQQNADNASNPLLTFTLKVASPGPDCADSADCGAC